MAEMKIAKPQELGLNVTRLKAAQKLLKAWTDQGLVPGGAIVVGRRGRIVEPIFHGRQGPEKNAPPIRRDGMFLLASITKTITYTCGLMLVERGQLNLSDKVTRYLPDFAAHHKEDVLVQQLFTHTSGMPDMVPDNVELRRKHAPLSRFIKGAIRDTVPLFRAGTNYSYQSMGTLVVAELVQKISGKSIARFMRDEIFQPLGLKSIGLGSKGLARERLVRVETPAYQAQSDYGWNGKYWQELGVPWGGMFASPQDFAVLAQLMLNRGQFAGVRLLSPFTVDMATTNRFNDEPELPESLRRSRPWGLGWRMNHPGTPGSWSDLLGRHVFGHTGATGTMAWMDRERDGFCLLFTSAIRSKAPWRLVQLSNIIASAFE